VVSAPQRRRRPFSTQSSRPEMSLTVIVVAAALEGSMEAPDPPHDAGRRSGAAGCRRSGAAGVASGSCRLCQLRCRLSCTQLQFLNWVFLFDFILPSNFDQSTVLGGEALIVHRVAPTEGPQEPPAQLR
jgi:hypothetical protein